MSKKQYAESIDVCRLAFWIKETKNGNTFLSGFAEFNDGTKVNLRVFKADEKKNENSPDYFGKGSVEEGEEGCEVTLDEYENKYSKKQSKPARKQRKAADDEVPPF